MLEVFASSLVMLLEGSSTMYESAGAKANQPVKAVKKESHAK